MKRIRILLILLLLILLAAVIFWRNLNHTGPVGLNDFALKYPEKINKIFLSSNNKTKEFVILEKGADGVWWVKNDTKKYKADTFAIRDLLFYVMARIEVKNPINDAALAYINKELALHGVKAEFYANKEEVLKVYAGGPTTDLLGTYMYLPDQPNGRGKHDRPCVVAVQGHNGYITPYFNTDINNWRTHAILDVEAAQIGRVIARRDPSCRPWRTL